MSGVRLSDVDSGKGDEEMEFVPEPQMEVDENWGSVSENKTMLMYVRGSSNGHSEGEKGESEDRRRKASKERDPKGKERSRKPSSPTVQLVKPMNARILATVFGTKTALREQF